MSNSTKPPGTPIGHCKTLAEFRRKLKARTRIAGPDDPIYKSGLTMTSVRRPPRDLTPEEALVEGVPSMSLLEALRALPGPTAPKEESGK